LEISHETAIFHSCDRIPDRGVHHTCGDPHTGSTDDSPGGRGADTHDRASDCCAGVSDKPVNGERGLATGQLRLREYARGDQ
jgi:hypothetical protein